MKKIFSLVALILLLSFYPVQAQEVGLHKLFDYQHYDINRSTAPTNGQTLIWNTSIKKWTPHTVETIKGTTGGYQRTFAEATSGTLSGASGSITVAVPTGSNILGIQLRVDTAITGAVSWNAAFSGGNTAAIVTGAAVTLNTKINSFSGGLTTNTTQIALTPGGSNFTGGVVRAIVYYETFTAMGSL